MLNRHQQQLNLLPIVLTAENRQYANVKRYGGWTSGFAELVAVSLQKS